MPFHRMGPGRPPMHRRPERQAPPFMPWQPPRFSLPPSSRPGNKGLSGITGHMGNIMKHIGTVQNGYNMLRQMGWILSLFK
ncbi:hypothetical protein [Peribacillus sp. SCS-155]|uniref:hypothetical protein n=1 Tax=Peribacillus sedimenti TaxID=3115297 RepID=UPI003905F1E3